MAATMSAIDKFTTDCANNCITPSTHTVESITTATDSEKRVGMSVEVPYTPLQIQNDAPEPLGREKDTAPIGPESPRRVNLSKLSSLESNFDEGYDSDGERVPWCDVIALEGEYVNVSEDCPVDTDSANKESEYPPPIPVDNHIPIE